MRWCNGDEGHDHGGAEKLEEELGETDFKLSALSFTLVLFIILLMRIQIGQVVTFMKFVDQ